MAYIDLNPVRAQMVTQPEDYEFSSYGHYAGRRTDRLITPHALYWSLGNTPFAREAAYAELVHAGISADQQGALTDATLSGWALGDESFVADLQTQTARRLLKTKAGRPFSKALKSVPN
jgi:putative transposase